MITVITEDDQTFPVDVDASIELENLKALLEVDSNVPAAEQQLLFGGQPLSDDKATLSSLGVQNDDLLVLRDRRRALASRPGPDSGHASAQNLGRPASNANRAAASGPSSSEEQAAEQLRQQLLSDPAALPMLRANNPELADAMQNNPTRFLELLRAQRDRMGGLAGSAAGSGLGDSIDEFDIDAQRRIEEAIRQERVMENLEHAMEYSPESFGRVTMLYVDCKVNGTDVKAFVDSGAQATIMSPECAEKCGIMRLLDRRFAGIARGVGTAKILGRVHSTQLQLGQDIFLPCSFTIMEGKGVDMLFGLDMLKRYQATIDLSKNALVINGTSIRFLDEHELPAEANAEYELDEHGNPRPVSKPSAGAGPSALGAASANANAAAANAAARFPGSGNTLGSAPTSSARASNDHFESHGWSFSHPSTSTTGTASSNQVPSASAAPSTTQPQTQASTAAPAPAGSGSKWPEATVQSLIDLGATRTQAIGFLDAANGNVEVAASLLFQQ